MRGSMLRAKLHAGQPVYGICMEGIGQARWPKYFADLGLDYVWLESEHSPNNRESLAWAAQLYAALGIAPPWLVLLLLSTTPSPSRWKS